MPYRQYGIERNKTKVIPGFHHRTGCLFQVMDTKVSLQTACHKQTGRAHGKRAVAYEVVPIGRGLTGNISVIGNL